MVIGYDNSITDEWKEVEIGDIAKFSSGKSRPKNTTKKRSSVMNIPVYGGNGVLGYTDSWLFDSKKIILGRVGEYCGCAHITEEKSWISDNALYLKEAKSEFSQVFLKNCFQFLNLNQYSNKMGQPLITQSIISKVKFILPSLTEQRKIAHILTTVQKAIEKQEEIIKATTEVKKAMMQKLFTEGLHGEPQKETEIGLVPESWEVVEIGDLFKFTSGKTRPKNISKEETSKLSVPVYGGNGVLGYSDKIFLEKRTLILGRVGEYCGCAHLTEDKCWISDNALYAKEIKRDLNLFFMKNCFEFLNLNQHSNKMGQPLITQGIINKIKLGLPKKVEQNDIAKTLNIIDNEITLENTKRINLKDLFKSLLNQLMSGRLRVNNIDFPNMELN